MKITKSQFKSLMKECLTELISEGAFDKKIEQIAESKIKSGGVMSGNVSQTPVATPANITANPSIASAINTLSAAKAWQGKKSLFEEILKDTAATTLQKQLSEEGFGASGNGLSLGGVATEEERQSDVKQLTIMSNGDPGRWARAAFSSKKRST